MAEAGVVVVEAAVELTEVARVVTRFCRPCLDTTSGVVLR